MCTNIYINDFQLWQIHMKANMIFANCISNFVMCFLHFLALYIYIPPPSTFQSKAFQSYCTERPQTMFNF
jgi:hypothetical protein